MLRPIFLLPICLLITADAAAEDYPESEDVQVTTSTRAPIEAFDSERSENVVSSARVRERQPTSMTDALAEETGVQVQRTNRGAGTLILRGLVGPENLIVVDGVRFNQSTFRTGPNQYLDTIDPWAVRQIEVVRGPGGVLYGSGAMGGVVQVLPLDLPQATEARARFGFHSADHTASAAIDAGSRRGPFAARAGVTRRRHGTLRIGRNGTDGFTSAVSGNEFLAQPYDDLYLRGGVAMDVGPHTVRANYQGGVVRDAMRLDRLGQGEVRVYDNEDHLAYITGEFDGPSGVDELRANVSWHRTGEIVDRYNCVAPGGRVQNLESCASLDRDGFTKIRNNRDIVDTFGSSIAGVSRLMEDALTITWGADGYYDTVASERSDGSQPGFALTPRDRGNFADGSTYYNAGAFGLVSYDIARMDEAVFRAHAGTRVEGFGARAPEVSVELGDVAYDFQGVVGSAGLAWMQGTTLNAYLNWNQGFRAPNLQETTVLGDTGSFYEIPNADLGPERSDTFEFGAKVDWAEVLRIQPAVWASLLSRRITREPGTLNGASEVDGKEVRRRVNRDSAHFYGADLAIKTYKWHRTSLYGSVTWVDGGIGTDTAGEYENPRRLPPVKTTFGVRYEPTTSWYITAYLVSAAAQTKLAPDDHKDLRICEIDRGTLAADVGEECSGTAGWTTFNARAGYRYQNMTLDVSASNLTDERYRLHGSGVPASGFDLAAQLTLEY